MKVRIALSKLELGFAVHYPLGYRQNQVVLLRMVDKAMGWTAFPRLVA
ncbi:hypothetical protein NDA03_03890 [Trichocoleus sp. Lan]